MVQIRSEKIMADSESGKNAVGSENSGLGTIVNFAQKWILPFVIVFLTWQHNNQIDLERRINLLEKEAVTQTALQITEKRWAAYVDVRIADLASKQDQANRYLQILVENNNKKK